MYFPFRPFVQTLGKGGRTKKWAKMAAKRCSEHWRRNNLHNYNSDNRTHHNRTIGEEILEIKVQKSKRGRQRRTETDKRPRVFDRRPTNVRKHEYPHLRRADKNNEKVEKPGINSDLKGSWPFEGRVRPAKQRTRRAECDAVRKPPSALSAPKNQNQNE